ncbi:MAG TPA: hypothetical protein VF116_07460 [Ktedonobacterales bacterium]
MNGSPPANLPAYTSPPRAPRDDVRLRGQWLVLARVGWVVAALIVISLDVLGTSGLFHLMQQGCDGSQCVQLQLESAQMRGFLASGLSVTFLAAYNVSLYWIGSLVYATIGVTIFLRRSDDRMALFAAFTLVVFGAGPVFGAMSTLPVTNPLWTLPINLVSLAGTVSFYVFFCLFPSGRFVPRWIRWAALLQAAGPVASVIPYPPLQAITGSNITFVTLFGLLVAAQVYRYRRVSTLTERQQTKWVVLGFALGLGGFLAWLSLSNVVLSAGWASRASAILFFETIQVMLLWLIPISIAVAIMRSRLFDIDVIINRTLVYGSLTAILVAVYFASVVGLQHLAGVMAGPQAGDNPLIIVVSTLLIAALFTPLRGRIQRFIDRRFYRAKYDTARTLERFAATLRSETDLVQLGDHLMDVVEATMRPSYVSLWLQPIAPARPASVVRSNQSLLVGDER